MRVQWYIFGIVSRTFLGTVVSVTGAVFLVVALQSLGRHDNLSMALVLSRLPWVVPAAATLAIPIALLLGTLLAFGRLAADNELLALRMGGIHPFRAVTPALALGLAMTVVTFWINGTLAPKGQARAREVSKDDLRIFLEGLENRPTTTFSSDRMELAWESVDEDGAMLDVAMVVRPEGLPAIDGSAARMRILVDPEIEYIFFELTDFRAAPQAGLTVVDSGNDFLSMPVWSLFGPGAVRERRETIPNEELLHRLERDPRLGRPPTETALTLYRTEYAARFSLAAACLVFVLVGAPLGMRFKHGSFVGSALLALGIAFAVYYPLHQIGWELSIRGVLPAWSAMALAPLVVGSAGLVLLHRARIR